jgi:hypothetical protein
VAHTGEVSTATDPDVIEVDGVPRRTTRLVAAVAAVVLVAGLVAWAEGVRRAPDEAAALTSCADDALVAVERAELRLATMANYVGPSIGSVSDEVDTRLRGMIAAQAPAAREPVDDALAACRAVEVWPLNSEHREARDAFVAFVAAEQQRLRALEREGRGYYTGYDRVRSLRDEAEALLP